MTSIRKYLYATVLAASALTFTPTLAAAAEPAHGQFTLPHEVHWQNAVIPAGEYEFVFEPGTTGLLTLNKVSGSRTGFMLLVNDVDEYKLADDNQLVMQNTANGSYVQDMQLPKFGIVMHFQVPGSGTPVARTAAPQTPSGQ